MTEKRRLCPKCRLKKPFYAKGGHCKDCIKAAAVARRSRHELITFAISLSFAGEVVAVRVGRTDSLVREVVGAAKPPILARCELVFPAMSVSLLQEELEAQGFSVEDDWFRPAALMELRKMIPVGEALSFEQWRRSAR